MSSIWIESRSSGMRDPYRRLAAGIVKQAVLDCTGSDPARRWDALLWLTLAENPRYYLELLGYNHNTALDWLRRTEDLRSVKT